MEILVRGYRMVFFIIYFFILGAVLGSFYNVVGYRIPNGMSIIKPASHCPKCNHKLSPIELIPIISYLIQGAKCKSCKSKIPVFYAMFEALTGLLFAGAFMIFGFSLELIIALTFLSLLMIVMVSDYNYMIIPDEIIIFGVVVLLLEIFFVRGLESIIPSLISGFIASFIILSVKIFGDTIFKKESMGGGDIKLMFLIGLVLPLPLSVLPLFIGSFIALPISLIVYVFKKDNVLPFGPYLSIAALMIYFSKITETQFLDFIVNLYK